MTIRTKGPVRLPEKAKRNSIDANIQKAANDETRAKNDQGFIAKELREKHNFFIKNQ